MIDEIFTAAKPYITSVLRHGLTALGVYLAAKGLPGLDDPTITNLAALGVGLVGMGLSWAEKAKR